MRHGRHVFTVRIASGIVGLLVSQPQPAPKCQLCPMAPNISARLQKDPQGAVQHHH